MQKRKFSGFWDDLQENGDWYVLPGGLVRRFILCSFNEEGSLDGGGLYVPAFQGPITFVFLWMDMFY